MYILEQEFAAIIFDMDGLILDNGLTYKIAYQKSAQRMGYYISDALYQQFVGRTHAACEAILHETFGDEFSIEMFASVLEEEYHHTLQQDGVNFRDGFEALFCYVAQRDIPIGLATSSPFHQVKNHLEHTEYMDKLDVICTIDDVRRGKPDPEIYQLTTERMQVPPEKTIVFEDSNNGMRAAIATGCISIMVPNQTPPDQDVGEGAFLVASSLGDIIPLFQEPKQNY